MTKAQRKILVNWCWLAALLVIASIFNEWILKHWETLRWPVFAALLLAVAFRRNQPSRAEMHLEFNQFIDEHPWIKIYIAIYGIAIAIGDYYAIAHHINVIEHVSFLELFGAFLLLFLPILIVKQKQAWDKAGL